MFRGAEHNGKGLKAVVSTIYEDTLQYFLKIHFCLDSGFLFFLELPEIPTSKFSGGAEYNGKGLKALAFTVCEIIHSILSKYIFA